MLVCSRLVHSFFAEEAWTALSEFKIENAQSPKNKDSFRKKHFSFFSTSYRVLAMKLDPVGSTVRYEMIKVCTGSI